MYVGIIDLRKAVHCCSIEESKHDTTAEGWDGMGCRALNCMHKMEKRLAGDAPQNSLDSHREVSKAGLVHKGLSSSSCSSQLTLVLFAILLVLVSINAAVFMKRVVVESQ